MRWKCDLQKKKQNGTKYSGRKTSPNKEYLYLFHMFITIDDFVLFDTQLFQLMKKIDTYS